MNFSEYAGYDATGLAELVRRSDVRPEELIGIAADAARKLNPHINAIVFDAFEAAREQARRANSDVSPFSGVPLLLKDLLADCAGMPTRRGSALGPEEPVASDSEHVRRLRQAGFVPLGKTNTPEFGLVAACEPALYGASRNPWDLSRSTGGSSGGSAAAVAARIVPVAHGNDYGGSIRVPSSCCGLVGLKPTRGRVPSGPVWGDVMSGIQQEHVLTRSVRDSASILDATSGTMRGDPYFAPPSGGRFLDATRRKPGRLRIAVATQPLDGSSFHPEVEKTLGETVTICEGLGHDVIPHRPDLDTARLSGCLLRVWAAGVAADIDTICKSRGQSYSSQFVEPLTAAIYELAKQTNSADYLNAIASLQSGARGLAAFFVDYDAWLFPTITELPLRLGEISTQSTDIRAIYSRLLKHNCYCWYFNMSGGPAISLPVGQSKEGLPIGMCFGADFGNDGLLLRLAAQLEAAKPWSERLPPLLRSVS